MAIEAFQVPDLSTVPANSHELLPRRAFVTVGCIGCNQSVGLELRGNPIELQRAVTLAGNTASVLGVPHTTVTNFSGVKSTEGDCSSCDPRGTMEMITGELRVTPAPVHPESRPQRFGGVLGYR